MLRPRARLLRAAAALLPALLLLGSCGQPARLFLDAPVHGTFLNGTQLLVEGRLTRPGQFASLTVNGAPVTPASDWSVTVPVSPGAVFNRITAEGVLNGGRILRESVTVVVGDGVTTGFVLDGDPTPQGVAMRVAQTGLDQITPVVESLSSDALDVGELITGQNPIAQGTMSGIDYTANVVEVGFGGFGLDAGSMPGGIDTVITIDDFFLEIDLDLDWLGSCTLEVETTYADLGGAFDLQPLAADPSKVDVSLVSAVTVDLGGFGSQFVSGICDDPLIGDIIGLILGQGEIQDLMQQGFQDNLADPDGAGPLDSPLAAAIEDALAGISIAGPVGDALGGTLDAPIVSVVEEASGLTLAADAAFTSNGPVAGAPDLPASYTVDEPFPTFGPTTPDGDLPYGLAFGISSSAMNQLLKTQIENGLLRDDVTEFLGAPLTAGALSILLPELSTFPSDEPAVIRVRPRLAPVVTGEPGPDGELARLEIAALRLEMEMPDLNHTFLVMELDLEAGLDLDFTSAGLAFTLAAPGASNLDVTILENPLGTNEQLIVGVFQNLFPVFAEQLEDAIDAFPIPSLLGLELEPVEVARMNGGFLGLFANLVQEPRPRIENVVFTDQSSADFRQQGGCWLREWRHRVSGSVFGNDVSANLRGMLGADAGCTTNDAHSAATAAYRVAFDVVGVPGWTWTLDLDHAIRGALDRISDGYNDGIGFQDGGGSAGLVTPVMASWQVVGGTSGSFDFTPTVTSISDGVGGSSTTQDVEFSGSAGATLQGTGDAQVELSFRVDLDAYSNSNTAFPTANGDEMAIRLGKNDTIDDNFTAGGYPGLGGRNIADDGHTVSVRLSSAPTP